MATLVAGSTFDSTDAAGHALVRGRVVGPRDFAQEAGALADLIQAASRWANPNYTVIAEVAQGLCRAGSAGVNIREQHGTEPWIRRLAVTGVASLEVGSTVRASCVPCGLALTSGKSVLITNPAARFSGFDAAEPRATEALCVPFLVADEYAGTIWVMSHKDDTLFNLGDVKVLQTLGAFTSTLLLGKRAREALQHAEESQRTLEALLEYIPEGITIARGPEVLITHVSRYGRDLAGRPEAEFSGSSASLRSEHWQVHFPDGRAVSENELPLTRASRQGEIVRNEELVLRRPDGTERSILCNAGPIRRKDGSIRGGLAAWRDFDELKRARVALQSSEETFRTLAECLPAKLFITDLDGLNTYANRRLYEFTGAPQGTLLGNGWTDYVHPDDLSSVQTAWHDALGSADGYEFEYRFRRSDGAHRWFLVRGQRFEGADGRPIGWCGAAVDIDDAHRARDALRAANETKDAFLATLAHELRNPLAPIRTAAQVLNSQRVDADALKKCTGVIVRQVAVMARLLDDLLDMSRITRGKLELRREPVLLWGVLGQAVETSRPLIDAHGHELVVRLPEDPVRMTVDTVRLTQVISNLLNNAAKFTPSGGRIELSAGIDEEGVFVRVADNGVGLVPGSEERIFGMFAQAGEAAPRGESGLGIGLALARALVELHGGRIEARSEGPGRGSVFCIRLPLLQRDVAAVPPARPTLEKRTCRVLLVDDNADILESLAIFLSLEGHEVRIAGSGSEALCVARAFLPEVVLLDIGMPNMDGYELARRLRQERGLELTRLIAITGWGSLADKEKASSAGFDLHLTKPVDPDQLLQVIGSFN